MMVADVVSAAAGIFTPSTRRSKAEEKSGWRIGASTSSPRYSPHPRDAVALHDVVGIQHLLHARESPRCGRPPRSCVPGESSRTMRHISRALPDVHDDRRDADDVVVVRGQFPGEGLACRKVQHRAGCGDVPLNHEDAPGTVEAAQRERALAARHLVVIQLHRVDGAAAVSVILCVRAEDGGEQDPGLASFGMSLNQHGKRIKR